MRLITYVSLIVLIFCLGSSTKITSFKGVLDRTEGEQAIILIESINQTIVVSNSSLPSDSQTNMWFNIELIDHTYKIVSIDYRLTKKRERKSTHLVNELRKKGELR